MAEADVTMVPVLVWKVSLATRVKFVNVKTTAVAEVPVKKMQVSVPVVVWKGLQVHLVWTTLKNYRSNLLDRKILVHQ